MTSCAQLLRAATPMTLVLAVAVAAAGCASGTHRSAAAGTGIGAPAVATVTQQHTFKPVTAVPATAKGTRGTCWTTSIAVPRAGAYRCLAGNTILDPCFVPKAASARSRIVACYADPWSAPMYMTLTAALPKVDGALPPNHPWGLRLASGARCVAVTGTVQVVGNVALTYACGGQAAAGLVNSTSGLRTAFFRQDGGAPLEQVAVTDIWTG